MAIHNLPPPPPPRQPSGNSPRRIVALCDRIAEVCVTEFSDLDPAGHAMAIAQVSYTQQWAFSRAAEMNRGPRK